MDFSQYFTIKDFNQKKQKFALKTLKKPATYNAIFFLAKEAPNFELGAICGLRNRLPTPAAIENVNALPYCTVQ